MSEAEGLRGRLLSRLVAERDVIMTTALQEMRSTDPDYAALDDVEVQELRVGMTQVFDLFLSCLAERRGLTVDEFELLETVGTTRARQGFSLRTVQRGFQTAFRTSYDQLLAATQAEPSSRALTETVADLTSRLVDLALDATRAISAGYAIREGNDAINVGRPETALVETILRGGWTDEELRKSERLVGRSLQTPAVMVVAAVGDDPTIAAVWALSTSLGEMFPEGAAGQARMHPCAHAVFLIGGIDDCDHVRTRLEQFAQEHRAYVTMMAAERLRDLSDNYRQLRTCIPLLATLADDHTVVPARMLRMYRVLTDPDAAAANAFIHHTLGPILKLPVEQRDRLIDTLMALQEGDGTIADAAEHLGLTPKGVRYRSDQIADLTGLQPTVPTDRFRLELATHLLRINPSVLHDKETKPAADFPPRGLP